MRSDTLTTRRTDFHALRRTLRAKAGGGAIQKAVVDQLCADVARAIGGAA